MKTSPLLTALSMVLGICSALPGQPTAPPAVINTQVTPIETKTDTAIPIRYKLSKPGKVSINIHDAKGTIVRELLHTAERGKGDHEELWDGRDDAGNPVAAGEYSWKLLSTPGFRPEYITSPGNNYPATVPDNAGAYNNLAPGSHGGPATIAVDASGIYIYAGGEGIENSMVKLSLDGSTRLWSSGLHASAMVSDGKILWCLNGGQIAKIDAATSGGLGTISGAFNNENPTDVAVHNSQIILSYPKAGVVRWLDEKGTETRNVSVAGAKTVDTAADGTVYVISDKSLLEIAPDATSAAPLVSGLVAPRRAAVQPSSGEIYLVDMPQWSGGQIKRFSKDGKLLQTYVAKGGRSYGGLYEDKKTDFAGVSDIAVEPQGRFWVAEGEAAPRRVARFNKTGTWVKDLYGGQVWGPWMCPEPDNPRFVWMPSQWGSMMRCEVDYATKTWKLHSTYAYHGLADGLFPNHYNAMVWEARLHNGELYLCLLGAKPAVLKVDRVNHKLIPVMRATTNVNHDANLLPQWLHNIKGNNVAMIWTDANGDGRPLNADGTVQMNEIQFSPAPTVGVGSTGTDPSLNILFGASKYGGAAGVTQQVRRWTATWNAAGAPVYKDFPEGTVVVPDQPSRQTSANSGALVTGDAAGNIWGALTPTGLGWANSADAFIARWNAKGSLQWQSGRKADGRPGSLGTFRRIFGLINNGANSDCLVVGRYSNEWQSEGITPVYVYDQDGLYAGQLLGQPLNQGTLANWRYTLGAEALGGQILRGKDGTVYFFSHWLNEGRVYKIEGWNGWERAKGSVTIPAGYVAPPFTPEPIGPSGKGTGLKGEYFPSRDLTGTPSFSRIDPVLDMDFTAVGGGAYSIRWTGTIAPRRSGWHMFNQTRNDGSPNGVFVNGVNVIPTPLIPNGNGPGLPWNQGKWSTSGRAIWLEAGKQYPIVVEHKNIYGGQTPGVLLLWSEPETNVGFGGGWSVVPQSQLSPPADVGAEPKP